MKQKSILLFLTIVLTIILFSVSTYLQRKIVNHEPKVECLFAKSTILKNQKVTEEMFFKGYIDIATVATTRIIRDFKEIEGLYAVDTLYKGQLAVQEAFNTKEKLAIYETESDTEIISIKIKTAENGVSYRLKPGMIVNVYVTLRSDLSKGFLEEKEKKQIGSSEYGYDVIQVLKSKEILDTIDIDGNRMNESDANIIDTIILAVSHEEAKEINLLREVGSFNVTSLSSQIEEIGEENETIFN